MTPLVGRSLGEDERFWAKVAKDDGDGCWNWIASKHPKGYGQVFWRKKMRQSHRVSYQMAFGEIPDGMLVCHRCDNPPCVRPSHLFIGSPDDNILDAVAKGRAASHFIRKLTPQNKAEILRLARLGSRQCDLAMTFGVSRQRISQLVTKTTASPLAL